MYQEIIFTEQLTHHRVVASQIAATRLTWDSRCSWFPEAQRQLYDRYDEIYAECLEKYGNDHFEYYARRNRLNEKHLANTKTSMKREKQESEISMDHIKNCRASPTTNGEYGRIKPMKFFDCFP